MGNKYQYVECAKLIATEAHKGQKDKAGADYIHHPERVANRCKSIEAKIVAWLHDTVEDTDVTIKAIEKLFDKKIAEAVEAITHREGEKWNAYIDRIAKNPIAVEVKISDLIDNSNLSRLPVVKMRDVKRQKKYNKTLKRLLKIQF